MDVHHNLVQIVANGCELEADEMAALKAMYDGEIAYTDERVGDLYETIQRERGETIIVITADHGELFGEDEMLAHKYSMHNAVLNVPMVIQGLSGLSEEGIIQHSDVMRTLLEVAGAETETIQGVDLRTESRKYAISQSPPGSIEPLLEYNSEFDRSKFPTDAYSVMQDGEFKYIARPDEPRLYQLPDELSDLHDEYPERTKQMEKELCEWLATDGNRVGTGEDIDIDEQMRSRLADLGYLDHEM
jgi:uncharacterized sulfatase